MLTLAKQTYVGFTMVLWKRLQDEEDDLKIELLSVTLDEPFAKGSFTDICRWKSGFKETKPPAV